jgi:hypothetical protein
LTTARRTVGFLRALTAFFRTLGFCIAHIMIARLTFSPFKR